MYQAERKFQFIPAKTQRNSFFVIKIENNIKFSKYNFYLLTNTKIYIRFLLFSENQI
tara:strand:- start:170 stop:340 length:171 start_codon:yes stop_codon:yes gene_type:complete